MRIQHGWWLAAAALVVVSPWACGGGGDGGSGGAGGKSDASVDGGKDATLDAADAADVSSESDGGASDAGDAGSCQSACGAHGTCIADAGVESCVCELAAELVGGTCVPRTGWWGVGGSELGPWSTHLAPAPAPLAGKNPSLMVSTQGSPVVAFEKPSGGIAVEHWDGTTWTGYGSSDSSAGLGTQTTGKAPALALDSNGRPVVAWVCDVGSGATSSRVCLRRWDGTSWIELGGSGGGTVFGSTQTSVFALAVGTDDNPVVSWMPASGSGIFVAHWTGASWAGYAGSNTTDINISYPGSPAGTSIAVDASNYPVVAYATQPSGFAAQIQVKRWDGAKWNGSAAVQGSSPVIVLDTAGNPVLDYQSSTVNQPKLGRDPVGGTVFHGSLNGNAVQVKTNGSPIECPSIPSAISYALAGAPGPLPVVAFEVSGSLYVRRCDVDWQDYGEDLSKLGLSRNPGRSSNPRLVIGAGDRITAVWEALAASGRTAYARSFDGTAWSDLPSIPTSTGAFSPLLAPRLTLDPQAEPVLSWADSVAHAVKVERWSGGAWQEVTGPASPTGTFFPEHALAVDAQGALVLVHPEQASSQYPIRVARWDGSSWTQLPDAWSNTDTPIDVDIALDSTGAPTVALTVTGSLIVARFNAPDGGADAGTWSDLAGSGSAGPVLQASTFAGLNVRFDASGRTWVGTDANGASFVRRYAGDWVDADGTKSGAPPGSGKLSLALSGDDPLVATDGVQLSAWTGSAWGEISGSATSSGISNSAYSATNPSVATLGHLVCVAWEERGKIVARCAHR